MFRRYAFHLLTLTLSFTLGALVLTPQFQAFHDCNAEMTAQTSHSADHDHSSEVEHHHCHCPIHRCASACHLPLLVLRVPFQMMDVKPITLSFVELRLRADAAPDIEGPFQPPRMNSLS